MTDRSAPVQASSTAQLRRLHQLLTWLVTFQVVQAFVNLWLLRLIANAAAR